MNITLRHYEKLLLSYYEKRQVDQDVNLATHITTCFNSYDLIKVKSW